MRIMKTFRQQFKLAVALSDNSTQIITVTVIRVNSRETPKPVVK